MAGISIIGIGNVLMGDDAFGAHVVKVLEAGYRFPPEVELVEAGTPGLDLTLRIAGLDALLVVDAVRAQGAPGEIRFFDKSQITEHPSGPVLSPHEPGLREALLTLDFRGEAPREVRLVGVVPASVEFGIGLSAPVQRAVPAAVTSVLAELSRLGVAARERVPAAEPDLWWERRPEA